MKVLVDASALIAMVTDEHGAMELLDRMEEHAEHFCCSVGIWEAVRAVARKRSVAMAEAAQAINAFRAEFDIGIVPVGERETRLALEAHEFSGKGTGHPARLNMGDCFAYGCAKAQDARLLYKGEDFSHTDLA